MRAARVLFPAIRWDPVQGFAAAEPGIARALALGVGGFIVFGGPAHAVANLTAEIRARTAVPLLIGADLERGTGQQFAGAVSLPPAAALGVLDDLDLTRRAGALTGREARALGIDWIYSPVADVDVQPANPIVGTRAFGADPERVAAHVGAWIDGCRAGGALATVKHFPGHGRTVTDSHLGLPVVDAGRDVLEAEMLPFRAGIEHGVDSVMTAHVAYPALDATGAAATLSASIVTRLLRDRLAFDGIVVTDALIMAGAIGDSGERRAAVTALEAGCDVLLYPGDVDGVLDALGAARAQPRFDARLTEAVGRIESAARRRSMPGGSGWGRHEDREWAVNTAVRALRVVRGEPALGGRSVDLITVDDDVGGPFPPGPRAALPDALAAHGIDVRDAGHADPVRPVLVALYADVRGWKGRPHVSAAACEHVRRVIATRPDAVVVLFGHPRLAAAVPGTTLLAAWGGDTVMQEAAARWLAAR
jgi:beta-glucosidase